MRTSLTSASKRKMEEVREKRGSSQFNLRGDRLKGSLANSPVVLLRLVRLHLHIYLFAAEKFFILSRGVRLLWDFSGSPFNRETREIIPFDLHNSREVEHTRWRATRIHGLALACTARFHPTRMGLACASSIASSSSPRCEWSKSPAWLCPCARLAEEGRRIRRVRRKS